MGKKAPALTVASLAMIMTRRRDTVPMPVTTPAEGAPPQSWYMFQAAHKPSSKKEVLASMSRSIRSRAVSRPLSCWRAAALAPPPSLMTVSSWCKASISCFISEDRLRNANCKMQIADGREDDRRESRWGDSCPVFALTGRRNLEHFAVLRHGAPGDGVAGLVQLGDQIFIAERIGLVFFIDDFQEF